MTRYVALLRGINVGGNNLIKMTALAASFEAGGFTNVATFIQSGNVLFDARKGTPAALTREIEAMLTGAFHYPARIVLRSLAQMRTVVRRAPAGFGTEPRKYRYDVLFLKAPLKAAAALRDVPTREGVDQAAAGPGVLYFSRLVARATQSRLSRVVQLPIYQQMTIRNWNTTTRLLELMEGPARS